MKAFLSLLLALGPAALAAGAQEADSLAAFQPGAAIPGTIRIWGDGAMAAVVRNWAEGFRRYHPETTIEARLMGTATGMPGIYLGVADLALLGREPNTTDSDGFLHVRQYPPLELKLMTGSLAAPGKSPALVVFVQRDNPLSQLTLAQLDGSFGCDPRREVGNLRTWGQLGLTGTWRDRPIHLYTYDAETGTGLFFLRAALGGSRKMNWAHLEEFKDRRNPDGSPDPASAQILRALGQDPLGLAVSSLLYADGAVKAVALGWRDGGPFFPATRESLLALHYPLARTTYAFVDRPPGRPVESKVREFLRYVYSREGQREVEREGAFLPLPAEGVREQARKLE